MKKAKAKSSNVTHEKLSGLPFEKAGELKEAEKRIQHEVWEQITRAKFFHDLTQREEYSFFQKVFENGVECSFSKDVEIVNMHVDKDRGCFKLLIPEDLRTGESRELLDMVESMIKGFSEGFIRNYLLVMGLLPNIKRAGMDLES